jgi:predicted TPR repeat methyltransferase
VTEFSAEWLELRGPYDLRARNPAVLAALAGAVADRASIAIVDLACGTGAAGERHHDAHRCDRRRG